MAKPEIEFLNPPVPTATYTTAEWTLRVKSPNVSNPFTDIRVSSDFTDPTGKVLSVEGFCDADDGTEFKVRYMPRCSGRHSCMIRYRDRAGFDVSHLAEIHVEQSDHDGMIAVDDDHRWHFIYSQSGKHCFCNGTTAYYLMGWNDEKTIQSILDRLAGKKINRVRVLLYGREYDQPWGQPVKATDEFGFCLNPWVCDFGDDPTNPNFDLARFNVAYWRKYERMVRYADTRNIQISVVFFIGGQPLAAPFAETSEDEYRYYRYAAARLAAFPNVTWDLSNEGNYHRHRYDLWTKYIGRSMRLADPYRHCLGSHNQFLKGAWNSVQLLQFWDAGLNAVCLEHREKQSAGRIIPQISEEYGYEDLWETFPGQRSPDTRRRVAWEIAMAGCYSTAGETSMRGTGMNEDTGGGWVNGRGDDSMTMLDDIALMVDFFTSFEWWKAQPDNALIASYTRHPSDTVRYWQFGSAAPAPDLPAMCLAEPGEVYVVYIPFGGTVTTSIESGAYSVKQFDPRTGRTDTLPDVKGALWTSPTFEDLDDRVFLLQRR